MKNLNVQEKSKGILLFAFNTDTVDYIKIAQRSARLIQHYLKLPITLVTDTQTNLENFDKVICVDNTFRNIRTGLAGGTSWRNGGRYQAYELSPYDQTLLLDSDYLILDQSLLKILDTLGDYRIVTQNTSPAQSMDGDMGILSLPYVWATVVAFNKTEKTQMLFDLVGRIQRNYSYYKQLYQIREPNFRNDYAFAIADNIINGYTPSLGIPWTMLTIDQPIDNIEYTDNRLIVREKDLAHIVPKQNIHIMDKDYLLSERFGNLVEQLCQE